MTLRAATNALSGRHRRVRRMRAVDADRSRSRAARDTTVARRDARRAKLAVAAGGGRLLDGGSR